MSQFPLARAEGVNVLNIVIDGDLGQLHYDA